MTTKKTAAKKTAAKKSCRRCKPASGAKSVKAAAPMKKGSSLSCGVCGLVVTVNEACGCAEAHEIICCRKPMAAKSKK